MSAGAKSEIRNPNGFHECELKQSLGVSGRLGQPEYFGIRISGFGFLSDFGIRISDL
jgi:hypothetical protein